MNLYQLFWLDLSCWFVPMSAVPAMTRAVPTHHVRFRTSLKNRCPSTAWNIRIDINFRLSLTFTLRYAQWYRTKLEKKLIHTVVKKFEAVLITDTWRVVELNWSAWLKWLNISTLKMISNRTTKNWSNQTWKNKTNLNCLSFYLYKIFIVLPVGMKTMTLIFKKYQAPLL